MSRIALVLVLAALAAGCLHDDDSNAAATPPLPDTVMDRGPDPFVFRTDAPEAYVRVDRMGVAAVATLVLPAGATRDQFNFGEPRDDGDYSGQIVPRLNKIHFELDDDLQAAGLTPCALDLCVQQAVPGIVPDVIHLVAAEPDGFPNARTLADPVVDRLVAIALLDLTTPGDCNGAPCTVSTFEDLPLNPPANEVSLLPDFPYFALPHPPPP
ncbi:MAG: hypothetical protein ACRES8_03925 [Nevskiaceae bacterium]